MQNYPSLARICHLFTIVCVLRIVTFRFATKHHFSFYNAPTFRFVGLNKREDLPIRPNPFQLVVRQVRKDKEYVSDPAALKQLKVIRSCFDKAGRIIVATDAGREGELIFRYIYQYLDCKKPVGGINQ